MKIRYVEKPEDVLEVRLSSLAGCTLHFSCCASHSETAAGVLQKAGDRTVADFISRLTCLQCGGRAIAIALVDQDGSKLQIVGVDSKIATTEGALEAA
jgi:hypothetical protein